MKVNGKTNQNIQPVSFKGIYNNKLLLKSLKFAADNGTLFSATASLVLSTAARPAVIMSTPKTDKENKKLACAKSISSSLVGYLIMLCASIPVASAVKKIDKNPSGYLKKKTIDTLKNGEKALTESKRYSFATQLFKLGLGLLIAMPKSALTCAFIPHVMNIFFPKKIQAPKNTKETQSHTNVISFKRLYDKAADTMAKGMGKIIDTSPVKTAAKKFCESNFAQHIMSLTDVILTLSFVQQTAKSQKIEESRKKPLIYNSLISTALCLTGGYAVNSATNKPTERFIKKFSEANKDLPELNKYIEGIKIAKPVLILGGIYYIFIPLISTFLADKADNNRFSNKVNYLQ